MNDNLDFSLAAYNYALPESQIAQSPVDSRDASRLMVVDCPADRLIHRQFVDIYNYLAPGDLLVVNNTQVFPARLQGKKESGGKVELLILEYPDLVGQILTGGRNHLEVLGLLRSAKRPRPGSRLIFSGALCGEVLEILADGKVRLTLSFVGDLNSLLDSHGQFPLPPYIRREQGEDPLDRERYQTVYASRPGAVAAPTAGLHFTKELLGRITGLGVGLAEVTLHVGYGTFAPVREEDIRRHLIHAEFLEVSEETAERINQTKAAGGRIWAVGTTSARALEFAGDEQGRVRPQRGLCNLFIYPGYRFRVVENLITNFHLPQSSLLFLVSALVGRKKILAAYREAVAEGYRFFSYGDAMALITRHPR